VQEGIFVIAIAVWITNALGVYASPSFARHAAGLTLVLAGMFYSFVVALDVGRDA
jgi:hypothetical protein